MVFAKETPELGPLLRRQPLSGVEEGLDNLIQDLAYQAGFDGAGGAIEYLQIGR